MQCFLIDPETQPSSRLVISQHNMHRPCGILNPKAPCMKVNPKTGGKECSKGFPTQFRSDPNVLKDGYPLHRSMDNSRTVEKGHCCMLQVHNQTWLAESSRIETRRVEPSNCESSLNFRGNARLETRQLSSKLGSSESSFGMGLKNRVELRVGFDSTRFDLAR